MTISITSRALSFLGCLLIGTPSSIAGPIPDSFYYVQGDRPEPPGGIGDPDTQGRTLTVDAIRRRMLGHVAAWTSVGLAGFALALALVVGASHEIRSHAAPVGGMTPTLNFLGSHS